MRNIVLGLAAAMVLGLGVRVSHAADDEKKITGVLIDNSCAEKFMSKDDPEKAAEKHPLACCLKCAKGDGANLVLIHKNKELKLDKHGQDLAMDYLKGKDAKTVVVISGEMNAAGDEVKVESIAPAGKAE